jgi:hypothetical protein
VNLSSSNAELDVSPTSLVFSPSDYSRLQYVTLTALGDSDIANDAATVTAAAEGGPAATLSVVILDFDLPAFDHSNTGATRRPPSP